MHLEFTSEYAVREKSNLTFFQIDGSVVWILLVTDEIIPLIYLKYANITIYLWIIMFHWPMYLFYTQITSIWLYNRFWNIIVRQLFSYISYVSLLFSGISFFFKWWQEKHSLFSPHSHYPHRRTGRKLACSSTPHTLPVLGNERTQPIFYVSIFKIFLLLLLFGISASTWMKWVKVCHHFSQGS